MRKLIIIAVSIAALAFLIAPRSPASPSTERQRLRRPRATFRPHSASPTTPDAGPSTPRRGMARSPPASERTNRADCEMWYLRPDRNGDSRVARDPDELHHRSSTDDGDEQTITPASPASAKVEPILEPHKQAHRLKVSLGRHRCRDRARDLPVDLRRGQALHHNVTIQWPTPTASRAARERQRPSRTRRYVAPPSTPTPHRTRQIQPPPPQRPPAYTAGGASRFTPRSRLAAGARSRLERPRLDEAVPAADRADLPDAVKV